MTSVLDRSSTTKPPPRETWLGRAWLAVVLIPVFAIAAFALGYGLYDLFGYKPENGNVPVWVDLIVSVATIVVILVPCIAAVIYGRRVSSVGDRRGLIPLTIGVLAGVGATALTVATVVGNALN